MQGTAVVWKTCVTWVIRAALMQFSLAGSAACLFSPYALHPHQCILEVRRQELQAIMEQVLLGAHQEGVRGEGGGGVVDLQSWNHRSISFSKQADACWPLLVQGMNKRLFS